MQNSSTYNPRLQFLQKRTKADMQEKTKTRSMLLGAAENTKKEETNPNPKPKPTRFVSSDVMLNLHSSTIKHVTMWVLLKWRWETGSYLRGHYRYIT